MTLSKSDEFDVFSTVNTEELLRTRIESVSFPQPAPLLAFPKRRITPTRRQPVFVPTLEPVPQVLRPRISHVQALPVIEVDFRSRGFPEASIDYDDRHNNEIQSKSEASTNLIRKILDRISTEKVRSGSESVSLYCNFSNFFKNSLFNFYDLNFERR